MMRWFRRTPKHLRGRVPAEGTCVNWAPPPDDVGRSYLRSLPRPPRHIPYRIIDEMRAALARHGADHIEIHYPMHLPGTYELHVFKDGARVAVTLAERLPTD